MCRVPYIQWLTSECRVRGTMTMPKWIAYCQECDRASTFRKIDPSTLDLAAPKLKKPALPEGGETWNCPACKRQTRVRDCDVTYSHAARPHLEILACFFAFHQRVVREVETCFSASDV